MESPPEILVIGSSNTDLVVRTERLPGPGETLLGGTFFTASGGKGANQAVAAARAGARVTFVARVGNDDFGRKAVDGFRQEGIDASYILFDPDQPSGVALIMVDARGENAIAVAPGANGVLSPVQVEAAAPAFDRASLCLLQLEIPIPTVIHALDLAAEHNLRVILNPAPACPLPREVFSRLFLITPNESETELLTGIRPDTEEATCRAAGVLRDQGVQAVAITLGSKGAFLVDDQGARRIPAPEVRVEDTTAAGDAFNGALACALGMGIPLDRAVAFANCAGALSVTRRGAQPSLPSGEEIRAMLKSAF